MNVFSRLQIGLLIVTLFGQTVGNTASKPVKPMPAKTPEFTLLESGDDFVRIQYNRVNNNTNSSSVFVGIPPDAKTELNGLSWKLHESKPILPDTDNDPSFGDTLLDASVKTKRMKFQELDVLRLTLSPLPKMPGSEKKPTAERKSISVAQLEFEIRWTEENARIPEKIFQLDAGYNRLFRNLCINGENASRFRRKRLLSETERNQGFHPQMVGYRTEGNIINPTFNPAPARRDTVRISVRETGMLAVRDEDLKRQGFHPDLVKLDEIRIWHRGIEQPSFVKDDGDGAFGSSDAIMFYGQESDSEFTNDTPYFMTWFKQETPPNRIQERPIEWIEEGESTFTDQRIFDEDHVLGKNRSELYGWFLLGMDEQTKAVPIDLPGFVPEGEARVELDMINRTRRRCGFDLQIGSATDSFHININAATTIVFACTAENISGAIECVITLDKDPTENMKMSAGMSAKLGEEPFLFINRVKITYSRTADFGDESLVLDRSLIPAAAAGLTLQATRTSGALSGWVLTDSGSIVRMTADRIPELGTMRLPEENWKQIEIQSDGNLPGPWTVDIDYASTLHRKSQGYSYVIVSHHAFLNVARQLAKRRAKEGFKVLLTDVQDIYDEFNDGYPSCDAIKRFLRYAQSEWDGLSPEFVVLVGDSNWDHRDRLGFGAKDWLPAYAPVNKPQDDASEEWYASLWGGKADYCPDVILGRISVKTPEEIEKYLTKLSVYENEAPVGPWKARNLLVTDDKFKRYAVGQINDSLAPKSYPHLIDQEKFPHESNPYLYHRFQDYDDSNPDIKRLKSRKHSPQCALAIIEQLNRGALIMQYIGHGGAQIWSDERIFYGTDRPTSHLLELKPNNRFPFVISWSCLTGYLNFHFPPFTVCLGEEFLRYADRGAIAMWAPTGSGTPDEHMDMAKLLMRNILQDGLTRVGEATAFTKTEYMQNRYSSALIDQYVLFGDPAVSLNLPEESLNVSVEPEYFLTGQEQTLTLKTPVSGFDSGQAIVSMTFDGNNIYESKPFAFDGNQILHEFSFSIDLIKNPTGTVRVYAWNEEKKLDGWGGIQVPLFKPELVLGLGNTNNDGAETQLSFTVNNRSKFDIEPVSCSLIAGDWSESVAVSAIPAGATVTAAWKGILPPSADCVYASVDADPTQNIIATTEKDRLTIHLRPPTENSLMILTGKAAFTKKDLVENLRVTLRVPFEMRIGESALEIAASLTGPGAATAAKTFKLTQSQNQKRIDFPIVLPEAGDHNYTVTAKYGEKEVSASIRAEVFGKPDLALAEGDVSVEPERPVLGRTVYLKTMIYNVGEGPASNITVYAYDGDPSQKRRLTTFNHQRTVAIPRLESGDMKEITIVWDPNRYEGLGTHEIHFVVDPLDRIEEISEDNNRAVAEVPLYDLPELNVDPWLGHGMSLDVTDQNPIPTWGQPFKLVGRVKNSGDTDAEYVRFTLSHNGDEITRFFDRVRRGGALQETQVDIPLQSAKNTLRIYADRYDLIGEKNETSNLGNNMSSERRLDLQLQMPEAPIIHGHRIYRVTDETHFTAGKGEFSIFDPKSSRLILHPNLEEFIVRLTPDFVEDKQSFNLFSPLQKWQWNAKYSSFYSPTQDESILRFVLPAPNGIYDVSLHLYSDAYGQDKSERIKFKTSKDPNYIEIEHAKTENGKFMRKIGNYRILDDRFSLELKSVPGGRSTSLGDIQFKRAEGDQPVSAGYLSPYFPAAGSGKGPVLMSWNSTEPEGTRLKIKARWIFKTKDGSLRFFPWAKIVDGKASQLKLTGRGQYFQYYAEFERSSHGAETPLLGNITISIPCKE